MWKEPCREQAFDGADTDRRIGKFYRLILLGRMETAGIFTGELSKDAKNNQVKITGVSAEASGNDVPDSSGQTDTQRIKTGIRPLMTGVLPGIGEVTYAEAELFTGKTHQIRAHFASMGYPLLGDPKYGNPAKNRESAKRYGVDRQLLHAYRVEFSDSTGSILTEREIVCPLPEDFERTLGCMKDCRILNAAMAER